MLRPLAAAVLLSLPAAAGSISGQVFEKGAGAIAGMTVRLWSPVYVTDANGTRIKSWTYCPGGTCVTTTTNGTGSYSFGSLAGPYLVDTLPGSSVAVEYTDRWYAPNEATDDFAGFTGATQIDGSAGGSGFNVYVLRGGGINGLVHDPGGSLLAGVFLRAELASNPLVHHNDQSQGGTYHPEHPGEFYFRNLPPLGNYQILSYWQPGTYETQLTGGIGVSSGSDTTLGAAITMQTVNTAADPNNGSHAITLSGATSHTQKYVSSGGLIAPRASGDWDEFCIAASAGDRYKLSASADVIPGTSRATPFIDPILRITGPAGYSRYDDDSGGSLNSLITDTGELAAGTYCARVSTFGDADFSGGNGQGSTGRFVFEIDRLNRRPLISATVPSQPAWVEGGVVTINLSYSDPDGDPLTVTPVLTDGSNNTVTDWNLSAGASTGTFTWTIPQGASTTGPYTATFTATDAPIADSFVSHPVSVVIDVAALAVPLQVAPADGARMNSSSPPLEIQDLTDDTQQNVAFEFELYDSPSGSLIPQSPGTVALDPSGHMVYFPAPPLAENQRVMWRVRAAHGTTTLAHSAWSPFRSFLVDAVNEPPPTPILVKPADGDEAMVRQPGFAATSQPDPEGDGVSLVFQLASDAAFANVIETSDPIGVTLANDTTPWTPTHVLDWGGSYYARVWAVDSLGAQSVPSDPTPFSVRPDALPDAPAIQVAQCQNAELRDPPAAIALQNVEDPDGEPITLELQLANFATGATLLDVTQPESAAGGSTAMDVSAMSWTEDAHYKIRARAGDGTLWTVWSECDFTLNQNTPVVVPDAGVVGTPDGGTNNGPPPDGTHRSGCNSAGASGFALLLGLVALALRRNRLRRSA